MTLKMDSEALRVVLRRRGMSASDLARVARISPQHVRGLVAGTRNGVSDDTALALAQVLDVPVSLLADDPTVRFDVRHGVYLDGGRVVVTE